MRVTVIDNYDSFTYNLVQGLAELGADVEVFRNDAVTVRALLERRPDGVVVSPGPGTPERAGISLETVEACLARRLPLLGVCLGHQALGLCLGARLERAPRPVHGKTSPVRHDGGGLLRGLAQPFEATRYHSWVLAAESCRHPLQVTARTPEGEVMGVRHRHLPAEGVQFHPESVLTREGRHLLRNFLALCSRGEAS